MKTGRGCASLSLGIITSGFPPCYCTLRGWQLTTGSQTCAKLICTSMKKDGSFVLQCFILMVKVKFLCSILIMFPHLIPRLREAARGNCDNANTTWLIENSPTANGGPPLSMTQWGHREISCGWANDRRNVTGHSGITSLRVSPASLLQILICTQQQERGHTVEAKVDFPSE